MEEGLARCARIRHTPEAGPACPTMQEVTAAFGDHSALVWVLTRAWFVGPVSDVWTGAPVQGVESLTQGRDGIVVTWQQMQALAASGTQVIDGCFTGYDDAGETVLRLEAVDSGSWIIWARAADLLAGVWSRFPAAEPCEEPAPAELRGGPPKRPQPSTVDGGQAPFSAHIDRLTAWLTAGREAPPWSRVEVVEVDLGPASERASTKRRVPASSFEDRWTEILRSVARDWVNVTAHGVDADVLVVGVEWCAGPRTNGRPSAIAVNLSGTADPHP